VYVDTLIDALENTATLLRQVEQVDRIRVAHLAKAFGQPGSAKEGAEDE